jgi:hypothetical protein
MLVLDEIFIQHIGKTFEMSTISLELEWFRCPQGYRVVHAHDIARIYRGRPESYSDPDVEWIVPNTEERSWYRPLDRFGSLWQVFANVKTSNEFFRFTKPMAP